MQAQDIYNSFQRYKHDLSDVSNALFLEWVKFTTYFLYEKLYRIDSKRFITEQSYTVVLPPQTQSLPSNFLNLNLTDCGIFKYDTRKRKLVTFDSSGDTGVTFSTGSATSVYNTNTYLEGDASRGFTGDAGDNINLSFSTALNLTDFADGGAASPTNDYISIWLYLGNTLPTSVTVEFSTSSNGSDVDTNEFSYSETTLVEGWNRIKVAKSAFTITGSPAWSSLAYLRLIHTGGDSTTNIYWDKLELVEAEVNGNDETDEKIGITGYGSRQEGYYLDGANVVFTGRDERVDDDYVMRYIPSPPSISALTDYITLDKTSTGKPLVEDRHLEYFVKAVDVLYEQWDENPTNESMADQRFVRALGGILDTYNRQPQISMIPNPANDF